MGDGGFVVREPFGDKRDMIGVRVHGRGGQGAVTFAHILAMAATFEGKYGQSSQGVVIERRGTPIEGYARIGCRPIAERGMITDPDYVVVIDPLVAKAVNVEAGLAEEGMIIANLPSELKFHHPCVFLDATSIALEILGAPITNTVMLGAFVAATGLVSLDSIEKGTRFIMGKKVAQEMIEKNLRAVRRAYEEVRR